MEYYSLISVLFSAVLGVVAKLVTTYLSDRKTKGESCFYAYITLTEEAFVMKTRRKSIVLMGILVGIYVIGVLNSAFHFLPVSEDTSTKNLLLCSIMLAITTILYVLLDVIIAFSEVAWLDKKLKDHDRNITHMDSWIDMLVLMVIFVGIIIAVILRITGQDTEDMLMTMYGILLLSLGLEAALNSFISKYVKMRRWYHVDNITIKTKTETHVYDNIFNYKKNRACYDFVYKGKDGLERIVVPIDEVMCVKYDIDATKSYLDYLNKAKKPCKSV